MSEKRKTERIKKNMKSEVLSEEYAAFSSAVDLSRGGIFISTPEPLGNGSNVKLLLHIPGHGELELNGVVRWVRPDETENTKAGMGIEFVDIPSDLNRKLDEFLK